MSHLTDARLNANGPSKTIVNPRTRDVTKFGVLPQKVDLCCAAKTLVRPRQVLEVGNDAD